MTLTCRHQDRVSIKRAFLGFRQSQCKICDAIVEEPFSNGVATFYWIVVALSGAITVYMFTQGTLAVPGVLALELRSSRITRWRIAQKKRRGDPDHTPSSLFIDASSAGVNGYSSNC